MGIYEDRQIHTKTGFQPIKSQYSRSGLHTDRIPCNNEMNKVFFPLIIQCYCIYYYAVSAPEWGFGITYILLEIASLDMPLKQPIMKTPQLKVSGGSNTKSFICSTLQLIKLLPRAATWFNC